MMGREKLGLFSGAGPPPDLQVYQAYHLTKNSWPFETWILCFSTPENNGEKLV
jgi:hypothetical protein